MLVFGRLSQSQLPFLPSFLLNLFSYNSDLDLMYRSIVQICSVQVHPSIDMAANGVQHHLAQDAQRKRASHLASRKGKVRKGQACRRILPCCSLPCFFPFFLYLLSQEFWDFEPECSLPNSHSLTYCLMASSLVPGAPVAQLFQRPPNPPRRYGPPHTS